MNREQILNEANRVKEWTTSLRHELHKHPERSFQEFETARLIRQALSEISLPYREVGTGTIVDIGEGEAPRIALRADIDALPIQEPEGLPFASQTPGMMHACGHDSHTAMLLGTAKILAEHQHELPGPVRLIFQPAEEGGGGALRMIEAGALEGVSCIYCMHVAAGTDLGKFRSRIGAVNAASSSIVIRVKGKSSHGSAPQAGIDAIVISSHIVLALQELISREISTYDNAVLTIGKITGGTARNILCEEVVMEATLRTLDDKVRDYILDRIGVISRGTAEMFRGSAEVECPIGYCVGINHAESTQAAIATVRNLFGESSYIPFNVSSMGSEDFAFYQREIPGVKMCIGTGFREGIHTPGFRLNEDMLPYGVAYFSALCFRL